MVSIVQLSTEKKGKIMKLNNLITSNVGMGFDKPTMSIEDLENLNLADLEILLHLNHREMEVYGSGNLGWQLLDDSCPAEFTPEGKLRIYSNSRIRITVRISFVSY